MEGAGSTQHSRAGSPQPNPFTAFTPEQAQGLNILQQQWQRQQQQAAQDLKAAQDLLALQVQQITNLNSLLATYQSITHAKPGPAAVEKCIQAVADPGKYEGGVAECGPWITNMRLWLKANEEGLKTNFDQASAILTRMKGRVAGRWAQAHVELYEHKLGWPDGRTLLKEIEDAFLPSTNREWARRKVEKLSQGNRRIEDWLAEVNLLIIQGGLETHHAMETLVRNINPWIRELLYQSGAHSQPDYDSLQREVRWIGVQLEELDLVTGKKLGHWEECREHARKELPMGTPMDIGATQTQGHPQGPKGGCCCGVGWGHLLNGNRGREGGP